MKKFISIILTLIMMFALCAPAFAAEVPADDFGDIIELPEAEDHGEETEKLNYLLIGDSIAYGAGILNHDEACYGRIVADTNGYNYKNLAVKGTRSGDLINDLKSGKLDSAIKDADIISLSVGGNDFIRNGRYIPAIIMAAFGIMNIAQSVVDDFQPNFCTIMELVKAKNPDATILVQTVYNPRYFILKSAFAKGLNLLNSVFYDYLEENPGAYEIVDVYSAMEHGTLHIALDTVHPSSTGNEIIAKAVLKKLCELGLGTKTEPVITTKGVDMVYAPVWWIFRIFL